METQETPMSWPKERRGLPSCSYTTAAIIWPGPSPVRRHAPQGAGESPSPKEIGSRTDIPRFTVLNMSIEKT